MNQRVAAILVGGKGTRLQPLVSQVPKPLAPIGPEPFLFLLIRDLVRVGYKDIVLLTGYRHEMIVAACEQFAAKLGANIFYSCEAVPLGTAGALKQAQDFLSQQEHFLLLNGDTYLDDFTSIAAAKLDAAIGLIGVIKPKENDRYGSIVFDEKTQRILSFQEKNQAVQSYQDLRKTSVLESQQGANRASTGVYKQINRLLAELAPARKAGGGSDRRTRVYTPVHEDSSTEPTNKFPEGVELCKKSMEL